MADAGVLAGLMFTKAQYLALVNAAGGFPSWADWNKFQIRAAGVGLRRGRDPAPWTLDVAAFHRWCRQTGVAPGLDGLAAYCQAQQGDVGFEPVTAGDDVPEPPPGTRLSAR